MPENHIPQEDAEKLLREAYVSLAFAFNRIHVLPRSRDTELAESIGRTRSKIEQAFKDAGVKI